MNNLKLPISAIILTYNEEKNLQASLESLAGWIDEILIVDSGSTDATLAIAERYRADIVSHPFESHARQWAWALENLAIKHEWILGLDADQRITLALRKELVHLFTVEHDRLGAVDGFYMKRRQVFRGQWIRHGGYYPKYLLKLFRKGKGQTEKEDLVDHHFYVLGTVAKLRGDIVEDNQKEQDIAFWIDKHNRYAALHAREEFRHRCSSTTWPIQPALFGSPDQRIAWLKRRWHRLPLYVRHILYFHYRYFLRLGFLDGKQGFIFHFLQGFWYRLLVDVHLDELLAG